jgi:hypothetical protein
MRRSARSARADGLVRWQLGFHMQAVGEAIALWWQCEDHQKGGKASIAPSPSVEYCGTLLPSLVKEPKEESHKTRYLL